jgi:hypothetical protein
METTLKITHLPGLLPIFQGYIQVHSFRISSLCIIMKSLSRWIRRIFSSVDPKPSFFAKGSTHICFNTLDSSFIGMCILGGKWFPIRDMLRRSIAATDHYFQFTTIRPTLTSQM